MRYSVVYMMCPVALILLLLSPQILSLSSPRLSESKKKAGCYSRRSVMGLMGLLVAAAPSQAACLQGDTSPDCIGFYKVPLDDAILPYVSSPEKLLEMAPDLRWVPPIEYPQTYAAALKELGPLKEQLLGLNDLILKGNLTEVGIELLGIMPRVTVAGRVVVDTLSSGGTSSTDLGMRAVRIEAALTEITGKLYSMDILLGQGLRDELGSLTAGQVQILGELKEANALFDELMLAIPTDFKPTSKK